MNDTVLAPLSTGTSDFETLRGRGQIYVDKTALIYELASRSEKFFLTRPRRFGKSLLVSTFASLFKNGLKYFSGLAIEKLWKDTTYCLVSKVRLVNYQPPLVALYSCMRGGMSLCHGSPNS